MKKQLILLLILLFGISNTINSQNHLVPLEQLDTIRVSDIKTTHLIFDQQIEYLDVGSPFFVADTTKQMVKLKHIGQELVDVRTQLSNLTVITKDGGYYSFILAYQRLLQHLTYKVKRTEEFADAVQDKIQKEEDEAKALEALCNKLDKNYNNKIHLKNGKSGDIRVRVTGIFYVNEKIGLRIELKNESTIDFDIDHILFRTKLKKRFAKDYLYQERVIHPSGICSDNFEIAGQGQQNITLIFDKFMLNEKEKLSIDIFETNGGRSATMIIPREELLNPKVL
ncbi:DUF4138 domain-containing protein [Aquimarina spongiae]|uniref:Bacteroides conjugative transposon TraN protein n=1 Tax=Aquimarina spongiae TaxID=570521 RepID=A0A1M6J270_9FLAO|nr:DUF4138 domain-containing protein [Aquimarina spongiae]SHJ40785.1 Bacteroides conjugative transposon TraN protein [Aquimarina spongiae]